MIISDFNALKERVWEVANRLNKQESSANNSQLVEQIVENILKEFNESKDKIAKIKELTERFDKKTISELKVSTKNNFSKLNKTEQSAIELAVGRIRKFHQECLPKELILKDGADELSVVYKAIDSVGIYVPGGTAPLLSTLMMTAIPAQVAGVKKIVVTSPPEIHSYILAVADFLEIPEIYQIGGVQAIAALAYGIPGLNAVDKIFGPGNQFVTAAKKIVYGKVGIDSLYGPSELAIIADSSAKALHVAKDLMSQLEHGSGFEAACLFTDSPELADSVLKEFNYILEKQPRKELIQKAWKEYGIIGITENLDQAIELTNLFAPEHLEIKTKSSKEHAKKIRNAGAIFLNESNEALGDYLAGPSHCLPTGRSARFSSGLSVVDFMKRINIVDLKPSKELVEATALIARMEGLEAHAQAALSCL